MLTATEALERLRPIICEVTGDDELELPADAKVWELGLESIDVLDLSFRMEREFNLLPADQKPLLGITANPEGGVTINRDITLGQVAEALAIKVNQIQETSP